MAGKLAKRPADAVFAAISSQCLSPLEKAFTLFLRARLGLRAPLEKAVLHRFPICEDCGSNSEKLLQKLQAILVRLSTCTHALRIFATTHLQ